MKKLKMIRFFFQLTFTLFLLLTLSHCTSERPEVKTSYSEEELNELLNQKKYLEIIQILEPKNPEQTLNNSEAIFLIYAHLGASDFKILGFASKITSEQKETSSLPLEFFPSCKKDGFNIFDSQNNIKPHCIAERIMNQIPQTKSPHFTRAVELFRTQFHAVESVSQEINFLGAVVELVSAFGELKEILIYVYENEEINEQKSTIITNYAKSFNSHLKWSLRRSKNTYKKINEWILGMNNIQFLKEKEESVDFITETFLPNIIEEIEKIENANTVTEVKDYMQSLIEIAREEYEEN